MTDILDRIRNRLEKRLEGAFDDITDENHGDIKVTIGSIRYTRDTTFPLTTKIELSTTNTDGSVETTEARNFRKHAVRYGLNPDDLGKTFTHKNHRKGTTDKYKITGLNTRAPKYPISATCESTGESYKFPPDLVKRALARAA